MLESILTASSANPHEPSVFSMDIEPPSRFPVSDEATSNFDVKRQLPSVFGGVINVISKNRATIVVNPNPLANPLGANLKPSGISVASFPVPVPPSKLPGFLRNKVLPKDLQETLIELQRATIEAEKEGFKTPSDLALSNAKRLLRGMYEIAPQRFEVYPTPDAEIAIRALAPRRSVLVLCEPDGGVLCFANLSSGRRRKRYTTTDVLPDSFLRQSLSDLKRESD